MTTWLLEIHLTMSHKEPEKLVVERPRGPRLKMGSPLGQTAMFNLTAEYGSEY